MKIKPRYHRIDGWRGYVVPGTALVGVSYTGEWSDSPCRFAEGQKEIRRFREEVLRPLRIKSHIRVKPSSNVFCVKRWLCVAVEDFERAIAPTLAWLERTKHETSLIHSGEIEGLAGGAEWKTANATR